MQQINNMRDLKDHFGCDTITRIQRIIFKSTECGCIFGETVGGVSVCGYAEGADAECEAHVLDYPFNITEFYVQLEAADQEGCDLFDEWNAEEEDTTRAEDDRQRADDINETLRDIGGGL